MSGYSLRINFAAIFFGFKAVLEDSKLSHIVLFQ
jgi:hypothetical protein